MNAVQSRFWAVRDYLAPVLRESKFKEHGRITPEEFVAAGDFLSYKFPTWQWSAGESSKAREYLPRDKQFLISKGVPCFRRVSQLREKRRRSRLISSPSSTTSLSRLEREARKFGGASDDTEQVLHLEGDADDSGDWILTHSGSTCSISPRRPIRCPLATVDTAVDLGRPAAPRAVQSLGQVFAGREPCKLAEKQFSSTGVQRCRQHPRSRRIWRRRRPERLCARTPGEGGPCSVQSLLGRRSRATAFAPLITLRYCTDLRLYDHVR